ncbi:hypothetical protein MUN46_001785 [Mesosutterella sp. AGMB02718]|uniref:Uncharacterized protein n=1 Tax=Mesosutterella faecium TaxID=2925194 RepID=A0ABT7IMZ2_9BURK|nr:hypothetical protein [Mesosutterella sp. AGMB02718]MDL2058682.1 hypothetical protein [Mesosutterella sp. AGMB02718]
MTQAASGIRRGGRRKMQEKIFDISKLMMHNDDLRRLKRSDL